MEDPLEYCIPWISLVSSWHHHIKNVTVLICYNYVSRVVSRAGWYHVWTKSAEVAHLLVWEQPCALRPTLPLGRANFISHAIESTKQLWWYQIRMAFLVPEYFAKVPSPVRSLTARRYNFAKVSSSGVSLFLTTQEDMPAFDSATSSSRFVKRSLPTRLPRRPLTWEEVKLHE